MRSSLAAERCASSSARRRSGASWRASSGWSPRLAAPSTCATCPGSDLPIGCLLPGIHGESEIITGFWGFLTWLNFITCDHFTDTDPTVPGKALRVESFWRSFAKKEFTLMIVARWTRTSRPGWPGCPNTSSLAEHVRVLSFHDWTSGSLVLKRLVLDMLW